jgi:hypothetical protein
MSRTHLSAAGTLLFLAVSAGAAEPAPYNPGAAASAIAPFVDDQTLVVLRLDVERFDPAAMVQHAAKVVPDAGPALDEVKRGLGTLKAMFIQAGGRDVYVLARISRPNDPFVGVIPLRQGADVDALMKLAGDPKVGGNAEKVGGAIVFGTKATTSDYRNFRPVARPELARAFAAAGGGAGQFLLVPTDDFRRVLNELQPQLPEELGGGPMKALTSGLLWAAAGLDIGDKLSLKMTVQSADADAAKALVKVTRKGFDFLGKQKFVEGTGKTVRDAAPGQYDELVKLLTPEPKGDRIEIVLDGPPSMLTDWTLQTLQSVRAAAGRSQSANNLKQMAIAMYNYHELFGRLPAAAICDKQGKPLLSWRVAILPYIEQENLYKEFKLDEPWDSEHNKKLIARMPKIYSPPAQSGKLTGKTTYLLPVGPEMIFTGEPKGVRIVDIPDGTSNTILMVEANDDSAVEWTKPDDLKVDMKDPLKGLIGHYPTGFQVAMADGSVRFIPKTIKPAVLWAAFTARGGEVNEEFP